MILVSIFILTAIIVGHNCLETYLNDTSLDNHLRYRRVSGGSEVVDDKFPYVVHIRTKSPTSSLNHGPCLEKLCTGTLIHPRLVLTHSNCILPVKTYITKWFKSDYPIPSDFIKVNIFYSINHIMILLATCYSLFYRHVYK